MRIYKACNKLKCDKLIHTYDDSMTGRTYVNYWCSLPKGDDNSEEKKFLAQRIYDIHHIYSFCEQTKEVWEPDSLPDKCPYILEHALLKQ